MSITVKAGTATPFVFFVVLTIILVVFTLIGRTGKKFALRKLPAIEAIPDAVGRAVEMGRPIVFDWTGRAALGKATQLEAMATISVFQYVLGLTAERGANLICHTSEYTQIPLVTDMGKTVYAAKGKPEGFTDANIRFFPVWDHCFKRDAMDKEKPAAAIAIGPQNACDFHWMQKGIDYGTFMIGGSARMVIEGYLMVLCDYCLITEEVFAAGAYLTEEPQLLCTVAGGDLVRYIFIVIIAVGTVLSALGLTTLTTMLKT